MCSGLGLRGVPPRGKIDHPCTNAWVVGPGGYKNASFSPMRCAESASCVCPKCLRLQKHLRLLQLYGEAASAKWCFLLKGFAIRRTPSTTRNGSQKLVFVPNCCTQGFVLPSFHSTPSPLPSGEKTRTTKPVYGNRTKPPRSGCQSRTFTENQRIRKSFSKRKARLLLKVSRGLISQYRKPTHTKTPKGMLFGWFYVPKNQPKSIP